MKFSDLTDQTIFISFSGGRTSALMTKWILRNYDRSRCVVLFANTGREHPKTLDFVNKCDIVFGFRTVWLEAVVHDGRKGCTHKVVDFETAARDGAPFEAVIRKYGIPNIKYPHCTRELKLNPKSGQTLRSARQGPRGVRVDGPHGEALRAGRFRSGRSHVLPRQPQHRTARAAASSRRRVLPGAPRNRRGLQRKLRVVRNEINGSRRALYISKAPPKANGRKETGQ